VSFTDQTTPTPTGWVWNFGDGSSPVTGTPTPTHTYTQAGLFPIVLAVSNGLCTDTAVGSIEVLWDCTSLPLQANFTASPNPVDLNVGGGTVTFTNTSTGATTYLWFFGTGDTSTAVSPSYAYAQPGTYTVMLIARNYNCSDTAWQTITVTRTLPSALQAGGSIRLQLFPNPAHEGVTVVLPAGGPWHLSLYNAIGQLVQSWRYEVGGTYQIDLRGLPAGYYTLKAESPVGLPYWGQLLRE
jgi:PKD repeat protein